MGVILKENNLIYTKMRHDKFIGSSCYKYDKVKNTIYKKEKLRPVTPSTEETQESVIDFNQDRKLFYGEEHPLCIFEGEPIEPQPVKRKKKTEYKLNKKKVREKCSAFFGLRQSRNFLAFYSISFPMGFPDDFAYRCLNTVLTRMKKECGLKSYLWVAERQKNETIHFHMLTNTFMYIQKVNYMMSKAIETQVDENHLDVNFNALTYNGVDVRHVNNNRKALNSYLTKYVSKNTAAFHRLAYHSSRDISELFTAETFPHVNCPDFAPIKETLRHIQTFVIDNDWCTVEYLCQKQVNGKYFNPPDEWYWLRDHLNEQIYKNHYAKMKFDKLPLG